MKVFYYVCTIACAMLFNNAAQAYYDSPGGGLSIGINDSSMTSTDSYTKYAAVNFISKRFSFGGDTGGEDDIESIKDTTCGSGKTLVDGICIDVNECKNSFPLTSVDRTVGKYVTKNCGDGNRYCYTACATGWTKSGCHCNAVDCSDFPHATTSGHRCNGVKSCKTGDAYRYKCTGCEDGYTLSGGVCVAMTCSDRGSTYFETLTEHCSKHDTQRVGDTQCFKCTECNLNDGWKINHETGKCEPRGCDEKYASSPVDHCVKNDTHKNGDAFCYKCTECNYTDGWTLGDDGKCKARGCDSGYAANPVDHCVKNDTHKNGDSFCYKCTQCNESDGWKLNASTGQCVQIGCNTGYAAEPVAHCVKNDTHKNGDGFCYKCTQCDESDGWTLNASTGQCVKIGCNTGYNAEPVAHCVKNDTHKNGDSFCYKCTQCNESDGWKLNASTGQCVKIGCNTGYNAEPVAHCVKNDTHKNGDGFCYKCTQCNESDGWKLDASTGQCVKIGCNTGYASEPVAHCVKNDTHKNGDGFCYKCTQCNESDGWKLNASTGQCVQIGCNTGYAAEPVAHCVKNDTHKNGDGFCYKCTQCNESDGWKLDASTGQCVQIGCDTGYAAEPVAHCVKNDTHKNGDGFCYKCTQCDESDGWKLGEDGTCKPKGCSAFYSETPDTHCAAFATHKNGDGFCYECTQCLDGWKFEGTSSVPEFTGGKGKVPLTPASQSCVAKVCGTAVATSDVIGITGTIEHCSEYDSVEKAGDDICTTCKTCEAGYQLNTLSKKCEAITCNTLMGVYGSLSPIEHCASYSGIAISGEGLCYGGCSKCEEGWYAKAGGCMEYPITFFPYTTTKPTNCLDLTSQKSKDTYYYKCNQCAVGYKADDNGGCTAQTCGIGDQFDFNGIRGFPSGCAGTKVVGTVPVGKSYLECKQCTSCEAGYKLADNGIQCLAKTCGIDGNGKTYDVQGTTYDIQNCKTVETNRAGTSSCKKCKACIPGYEPDATGTSCTVVTAPDGYSATVPWNCHNIATTVVAGKTFYKCAECSLGYMKYTEHDCIEKSIPSGYDGLNHSHCKNLEIGAFGNQVLSRCTECDPGWEVTGLGCAKVTAPSTYSGWSMTYPSHCVAFESKRSGSDIYYRCGECEQGYHRYEYSCIANTAPSGWKSTMPKHCTDVSAKLYGDQVKYYCAECASGYDSYGGDCIQNQGNPCCSMSGYACEPMPHCLEFNQIKSLATGLVCFGSKCKKCEQGYEFKNGSCTEVSHSGYSTTKPNDGCSAWKSLLSGNTIYYKCTKCKSGYTPYNATECIPS